MSYSVDEVSIRRHPLAKGAPFTMLDHWRRVAALQSDSVVFCRVAQRAAELITGESSPEDESLEETRRKAGGI